MALITVFTDGEFPLVICGNSLAIESGQYPPRPSLSPEGERIKVRGKFSFS